MSHAASLADDTVYDLLSDTRRLHLLALLTETGSADVDTLARQIAARERNTRPEIVSDDAIRRVAISLVHTHVPKLAEYDVVQHDATDNTVVLMDVVADLEASIDHSSTDSAFHALLQQ